MKAWRTTPQIAGCVSRSKVSSVRNPARRPTLAELLREPVVVVHPATMEDRVDESNSTDQTVYPPQRRGYSPVSAAMNGCQIPQKCSCLKLKKGSGTFGPGLSPCTDPRKLNGSQNEECRGRFGSPVFTKFPQ